MTSHQYQEIQSCRICQSPILSTVLDLGNQALTGVFPKESQVKNQNVAFAPLVLVKCADPQGCGLVQLKHALPLSQLYGNHYGYRSGLNASMVRHLKDQVQKVISRVKIQSGDLIIDIGSNDGTLLGAYLNFGVSDVTLLGVDPLVKKFKEYYSPKIDTIADFFSADLVQGRYAGRKAKVITSFAMFYDLEQPMHFMKQIRDLLDPNGIWVFEQSYLPLMLKQNSYDTVCHEHLEYYALKQIQWMAARTGMKVIDVELNATNGGSFAVTAAREDSNLPVHASYLDQILKDEQNQGIHSLQCYEDFRNRLMVEKNRFIDTLKTLKASGKKVFGYGASTKGNVILQYCGITSELMPYIMEVNSEKFGCYTPGTGIPIISEKEARAMKPDYIVPLPWHFRDFIIEKEQDYLKSGGKILFPLPHVEIVSQ